MKRMFCWRCRAEVPMLDEDEFERVAQVMSACFRTRQEVTELRWHYGPPLGKALVADRLRPVTLEYERITGFHETNPNAVMHHRLALLGPPCTACGKPLRTPQARFCAECGQSH